MKIDIRLAHITEINKIYQIILEGKNYLKQANSPQWQNGGPNLEIIKNDIAGNKGYVFLINNIIQGYMCLDPVDDNYDLIYEGNWINKTFLAIHRIVFSDEARGKGYSKYMIDFSVSKAKELGVESLRIDTHKLNIPMQKVIINNGFKYCGIIYVNDEIDRERLAFERPIK